MNIDEGGKGVITKEKREISGLERSANAHKKAIVALNLDGSFYKKYESITDAMKSLNVKGYSTNISSVLKNVVNLHLGIYESEYNNDINYTYKVETNGKSLYQFDYSGNLIKEYKTIKEFLDSVGESYNGLKTAIKNKIDYFNSFLSYDNTIDVTKYKNPYKFIVIKNNEKFYYKYQKDICDKINLCKSSVCSKLKDANSFTYNNYEVIKIN